MIKATNELYKQCEHTLDKACWDAWRKNPILDFSDYRSYADEIFMDATQTYDPAAGVKFNSWLTTQLLRLKPYAARYKMATDTKGKAESLVLSLDKEMQEVDGKACSLLDTNHPINSQYSAEIGLPSWATSWEERMANIRPFMCQLSPDARVMVDDILDGNAAKKDENGVPQMERGRRLYVKLTPRQLYTRLYRRKGWGFERVRDARIEVENMLRNAEPCKLPPPGAEVQVQDELF